MLNAIKELFSSKTFWLTVVGSAVCAGLSFAGASMELVGMVAGLFGIKGLQQGMADFGKNQATPPKDTVK
jgi:uncharacterized membrane protein